MFLDIHHRAVMKRCATYFYIAINVITKRTPRSHDLIPPVILLSLGDCQNTQPFALSEITVLIVDSSYFIVCPSMTLNINSIQICKMLASLEIRMSRS